MPVTEVVQAVEDAVKKGYYINRNLPQGGKIVLDNSTPFLCLYRYESEKPDEQFSQIVKTQASYIVAHTSLQLHELLQVVSEVQSDRFNSFFIIELWEGQSGHFCIYGPQKKAATPIESLAEGLRRIKIGRAEIPVTFKDTVHRSPPKLSPLLEIREGHKLGVLLLGLEIPYVYGNRENGQMYFRQFRYFKSMISDSLKKAAFDFSRVQTNTNFSNYLRFGKTRLNRLIRRVDAELVHLSQKTDLLLRVTPVNEQEQWEKFRKNDFKELPQFHYRLISIDPESEIRNLYNLPIEKIDDPTLAHIYREKREDSLKELQLIDQRETPGFLTMSRNLIGELQQRSIDMAVRILKKTVPDREFDLPQLDCMAFSALADKEIAYYKEFFPSISLDTQIRDDVTGLMVRRGRLFVGETLTLPEIQAKALLQHEVGTHILTYCNGSRQPMEILSSGLADYEPLQEGLAVFMEYLSGGLTIARLRILAARVLAVHALSTGAGFLETFNLLHEKYSFEPEPAFKITTRVFRGGGFTKDAIYLQGLLGLLDYLEGGHEFEILFSGKFGLKHVNFIHELIHRKIISKPQLPYILQNEIVIKRLEKARTGIQPLNMINNAHETSLRHQ